MTKTTKIIIACVVAVTLIVPAIVLPIVLTRSNTHRLTGITLMTPFSSATINRTGFNVLDELENLVSDDLVKEIIRVIREFNEHEETEDFLSDLIADLLGDELDGIEVELMLHAPAGPAKDLFLQHIELFRDAAIGSPDWNLPGLMEAIAPVVDELDLILYRFGFWSLLKENVNNPHFLVIVEHVQVLLTADPENLEGFNVCALATAFNSLLSGVTGFDLLSLNDMIGDLFALVGDIGIRISGNSFRITNTATLIGNILGGQTAIDGLEDALDGFLEFAIVERVGNYLNLETGLGAPSGVDTIPLRDSLGAVLPLFLGTLLPATVINELLYGIDASVYQSGRDLTITLSLDLIKILPAILGLLEDEINEAEQSSNIQIGNMVNQLATIIGTLPLSLSLNFRR